MDYKIMMCSWNLVTSNNDVSFEIKRRIMLAYKCFHGLMAHPTSLDQETLLKISALNVSDGQVIWWGWMNDDLQAKQVFERKSVGSRSGSGQLTRWVDHARWSFIIHSAETESFVACIFSRETLVWFLFIIFTIFKSSYFFIYNYLH